MYIDFDLYLMDKKQSILTFVLLVTLRRIILSLFEFESFFVFISPLYSKQYNGAQRTINWFYYVANLVRVCNWITRVNRGYLVKVLDLYHIPYYS
jgi:hypothetical protein